MADIDSQGHELQDVDLERYGPPTRRLTWFRKLVVDSGFRLEPSAEVTPESRAPRAGERTWSRVTLDILVRWSSGSTRSTTPTTRDPSPTPQRLKAQNALIFAVTGKRLTLHSHSLTLSCNWYTAFLEFKIKEAWSSLLAPILVDIDTKTTSPCDHDILVAFQFLTAVVTELRRKELALVNIVDEMYNKNLLRELETDNERSRANQLVFAALGWISILYTPSTTPKPDCLQLDDNIDGNDIPRGEATERSNSSHRPRTFSSLEESVEHNDQPLFQLLKRFGEIIPPCRRTSITPQELSGIISGRPDHWIDISLVCFHAVNVVAGVKIQWVDCLSLHLEFDSRSKTVKVFRFPSLCLIMYRNKDRSLLSQIFQDFAASTGPIGSDTDYTSDYFREVLLSYRLLFGENRRSRRAFASWIRQWQSEWTRSSRVPSDPILLVLGTQSWESDEARRIYDEINAEDPSNHYSPTSDFVFFGKRLLELQNYVRGHSSQSIVALWYDRRSVQWWWTFWAVIIIGGVTLLFALLQTVLQILQVIYAERQLNQGNTGTQDLR